MSLVSQGYREIVVTGICLGAYGQDFNPPVNLEQLLEDLCIRMPNGLRLRLSSIDPADISQKLINIIKNNPKICRHLHIPLQHGSDKILKRMNRRYLKGTYYTLLENIHAWIPELSITTDIMVGFPGEEEEDFEECYNFIKGLNISKIHVFKYCQRPGTKAATLLEKVPEKVKAERSQRLIQLSNQKITDFMSRFLGKRLKVLIEHDRDRETGLLQGYTDNYIKVLLEGDNLMQGTIREVVINNISFKTGTVIGGTCED